MEGLGMSEAGDVCHGPHFDPPRLESPDNLVTANKIRGNKHFPSDQIQIHSVTN